MPCVYPIAVDVKMRPLKTKAPWSSAADVTLRELMIRSAVNGLKLEAARTAVVEASADPEGRKAARKRPQASRVAAR